MIVATNITNKAHDNNEGGRPPLIDDYGVMRIDNSSLDLFTTCARSAEYYLIESRQLAADRVALRFGGAFHIVMEILYRDYNGRPKNYGEFFEACRAALIPYFDKYPPPPDDYRTLRFLEDNILSYVGYADIFDDFEISLLPNGDKAIEQYFEFDLGEVDFDGHYKGKYYPTVRVLWCGRIDMIVKRSEKIWILDHKTTTILGSNFFDSFRNKSAMIGYAWASEKILGQEVSGLYLNAIALRKPTKTGVQFEVQRQHFPYDAERIREWQYNTLVLVSDFLSHLDRGYFPMEDAWCVGKYGTCQYLDVCTMPPSQRHTILASNTYAPVTWNPKHGTRQ
jgi:PD-(D/E)XK nuclease superfamily